MSGEHEHRKTPIYIVLSNEGNQRSITLISLRRNGSPSVRSAHDPTQESDSGSSESFIEAQLTAKYSLVDSNQSSIN